MNRTRVLGILLITTGIVLNQFESENDFTDFIMGACVGLGLGLLLSGFLTSKSKET